MSQHKTAVIAIGGNSLILSKDAQTVQDQYKALCTTVTHIVDLVELGWQVVVTYGNGPQVGFLMRRAEVASKELGLHGLPLVTCVADTQGGIGYQIQQALKNEFTKRKLKADSVALTTEVVVDGNDPGFKNPTKPVGEFYAPDRAEALKKENPDWVLKEDSGRGFRRYVPSPRPLEIVEDAPLRLLLESGYHVVAGGGGGIPVVRQADGQLVGVDAVIDKDLTSSLLAASIKADLLVISTGVPSVALNFGKPDQKNLEKITAAEARRYVDEGHFAAGSMLPKILAALEFIEKTGNEAVITSPDNLRAALQEGKGTHIVA